MRVGVFAKTFAAKGALASLSAVRASGFSAAQFNMACLGMPSMPDAIPEAAIESIAEASRETGVAVPAVSGTYNMIHPDARLRESGLRRLAVLLAAARQIRRAAGDLVHGNARRRRHVAPPPRQCDRGSLARPADGNAESGRARARQQR